MNLLPDIPSQSTDGSALGAAGQRSVPSESAKTSTLRC
jgi:hypothetical protein